MNSKYEVVIGLEIHLQLSTKTKMFCCCDNESFNVLPNTNICPVCTGFPGTLPVINKFAVQKAIKMGLALNCSIEEFSEFERKNYFYPDLAAGYQISQFFNPISTNGFVEFLLNGELKKIRINRGHLENDAGKLVHQGGDSLIDYNRAGTPLIEVVTEPDIRSAQEASAFAKEIQKIARAMGVSMADMEKGNMRCDANVSLREKGSDVLNNKVEIKNINSFRFVETAINFEIKRQTELMEKGEVIIQETRGFDNVLGKTVSQREKEIMADYRYMPDPDLPPIILQSAEIERIKKDLPELPILRRKRLEQDYQLADFELDKLISEYDLADYFEKVALATDIKSARSWVLSILLKDLNSGSKKIKEVKLTAELLIELINLVKTGKVSNKVAKEEIYPVVLTEGKAPAKILKEKGLEQISDDSVLRELIVKLLKENHQIVIDFKAGKEKVLGFIVGKVMKQTGGKANPAMVNSLIREEIIKLEV